MRYAISLDYMGFLFIVNVLRSAPNPEDPLDATVAEHWTVSL